MAAAYGWSAGISDDEVLRELLALNGGRQEIRGDQLTRYWRARRVKKAQTRCQALDGCALPSCPKTRTERQGRILEAFSKLAETSRRGTGSAIGDPEQTSPADHPFRPTGAPELLCGVAVVIAEQAAQSLTTSHLPVRTADAFVRGWLRSP